MTSEEKKSLFDSDIGFNRILIDEKVYVLVEKITKSLAS